MDKVQFRSPYEGGIGDLAMSKDPPMEPAPAAPVMDMDFIDPIETSKTKVRERLFVVNSRDRRSGTPQNYVVAVGTSPSERIVAAKIQSIYIPNDAETLVDEHNKTIGLILGGGTTLDATIATGDYATAAALATAIETALDTTAATRSVITVTSSTANVGVVDISGGSTLTATLTAGTYTPTELAAELKTKLDAITGSSVVYEITAYNSILHFRDNHGASIVQAIMSTGTYSGTELATELETAMNAVTKTGYFTVSSPSHQFDWKLTSGQSLNTVTLAQTTYSGDLLANAIINAMKADSNYENIYTVSLGVNDTFKIQDYPGGSWLTITLTAGTYNRADLITEIDTQMNAASLTALYPVSIVENYRRIRFRDMPAGPMYETLIPSSLTYTGASLATAIQNTLNGTPITPRIKIGGSNNDFIFKDISGGADITVTVASADWTPAALATELTSLIAASGSRSSTIIFTSDDPRTFKIRDVSGGALKTVTIDAGEYTGASLATHIASKLNALTKTELYTIDATNNKLDFTEDAVARTATLSSGTQYTGDLLAAEIKTQMEAVGLKTYTVTFDSGTDEFTISISSGTLDLNAFTGANGPGGTATSVFPTIGFTEVADFTGLTTYTSDNPNAGNTPTYVSSFGSGKLTIGTASGYYLDIEFSGYNALATRLGYSTQLYTGAESYVAPRNLAVAVKEITVSYNSVTGQYSTSTNGIFLTLVFSTADIATTLGYTAADKTGGTTYNAETSGIFGTQSSFTCTYDGTDEFTISSNSDFFTLNLAFGLAEIIGFDQTNTGSTSYTSSSLVTGNTATLSTTYSALKFTIQSSGTYLGLDTTTSTFPSLIGMKSEIVTGSNRYTGIIAAEGTVPTLTGSYDSGTGKFTFTSSTGFLTMDLAGTLNTTLGFTPSTLSAASTYTSDGSVTGTTATYTVAYNVGNRTFTISTDQSYLDIYPKYGNYNTKAVLGFDLDSYSTLTSYVSDATPQGSSAVYTVTYNSVTNKYTIATNGSFLTLDFTVANPATTTLGFTGATFTGGTSYTSDSTTSAASQTFTVSADTATRSFTISSATSFGLDFQRTDADILLGFDSETYTGSTSYTSVNFYSLVPNRAIVLDIQQMRMMSGSGPATDQGTTMVHLEDSSKSYITLDSSYFPETYTISQLSSSTSIKTLNIEFRHPNNGALYNFHGLNHVITLILYIRESK